MIVSPFLVSYFCKIFIFNILPMQKGRDSNPRYGYPYTTFPGWPLQPLEHLSINFANV